MKQTHFKKLTKKESRSPRTTFRLKNIVITKFNYTINVIPYLPQISETFLKSGGPGGSS